MGVFCEKTVTLNVDTATAIEMASKAVMACGWRITDVNKVSITALTRTSFWSWGETVIVNVWDMDGVTQLKINTRLNMGLVDWGKNQRNVNKFMAELGKHVQIS